MPKVPVSNLKRGKSSAAGLMIPVQWQSHSSEQGAKGFALFAFSAMVPSGSRVDHSVALVFLSPTSCEVARWELDHIKHRECGHSASGKHRDTNPFLPEPCCSPNTYANYLQLGTCGFCSQQTIQTSKVTSISHCLGMSRLHRCL